MYSEGVVSCELVYIQVWRKFMILSKSEILVGVSPISTLLLEWPNLTITCHSKHIQKYWMLTIIIDVLVCVMKKIVDISIRIEIVPIFDFQINVHIHIEEEKISHFGSLFSVYFQGVIQITTSKTLHFFYSPQLAVMWYCEEEEQELMSSYQMGWVYSFFTKVQLCGDKLGFSRTIFSLTCG